MKKYLLLALAVCGICACTTPEEDAQIKLFWIEQLLQVMPQTNLRMPPGKIQPQPLSMPQEEQTPILPNEVAAQPQVSPFSTKESLTPPKTSFAKPHQNADPVAKQVLAKQGGEQVVQTPKHQFMEITLEDTNHRINRVKSNAPLKERQAMQRAIERVKQSNQQALQDIGLMFDGDTQAQAFSIVSQAEKLLMRTANTSMNYQNYLNAQQKILQDQDTKLNQLMRANAYKLRRVRG